MEGVTLRQLDDRIRSMIDEAILDSITIELSRETLIVDLLDDQNSFGLNHARSTY